MPGGDLEARFAVGAGMAGCSLTHRGDELLGLRGGLGAYLERGKTFGLPLLYPWANRLGAWEYAAAGRAGTIDRGSAPVRADGHGLPIHGALPTACHWRLADVGADGDAAWLAADLDWTADAALLAIFPFAHRVRIVARLTEDTLRVEATIHATGADAVRWPSASTRTSRRRARRARGWRSSCRRWTTSRSTTAAADRRAKRRTRPRPSPSPTGRSTTSTSSTPGPRASPSTTACGTSP